MNRVWHYADCRISFNRWRNRFHWRPLGSKVGKKKLSLFGLRPRHTSILVTIITGILITTVTFGILAIASKDVRTALFGMNKLKAELNEKQSMLEEASGALVNVKKRFKYD